MKIIDVKSEVYYGEVQLVAVYEDGSEEFLFGYFPEEYSISPSSSVKRRTKRSMSNTRKISHS